MEPRVKLWLEQDGRLVLSDYRVRLLRLVQQTGSLAQAAQEMQLSYRRAWGKIRELERNHGALLVRSDAGGAGGGSSRLTPEAERLLDRFEALAADLAIAAETLHAKHFGRETPLPAGPSGQVSEQIEAIADDTVHAP
jgi:molybdate transport system regulatory protein